jgi:hypothetical protein
MRLAIAIFGSVLVLAASEPQDKKKTETAPAKAAKPPAIPAGAEEREPGFYYYTDPEGKKWIYRKTPFGVTKLEDKPADANDAKAAENSLIGAAVAHSGKAEDNFFAHVKITEDGDLVKFERAGPFGISRWQKKKSDLTEEEKAALKKSQESSPRQDK